MLRLKLTEPSLQTEIVIEKVTEATLNTDLTAIELPNAIEEKESINFPNPNQERGFWEEQ